MILGVVLGNIAELNLSRALTITDTWETALAAFLTRPWSLLFFILAVFSAVFPWCQAARAKKRWTRAYVPLLTLSVSVLLFMMGGMGAPDHRGRIAGARRCPVVAAGAPWLASLRHRLI